MQEGRAISQELQGRSDVPEDLLFQSEIKEVVRQAYTEIDTGAGRPAAQRLYSDAELGALPPSAVDWALGVGNPVRHAALQPGETVLDVGCGAGIDTILAARAVGPSGRAIGLDLLEEMCDRARAHAQEAGVAEWTEFVRGEMEDIPLPDASVDVVISNGVINLSPRKSRVLAEIRRVLRPDGRISVADLTVNDELPTELQTNDAAWAG
jgi:SAM-dependent methyltransferase